MGLWTTERTAGRPTERAPALSTEEPAATRIPRLEQVLLFLAIAIFMGVGPEKPAPTLGGSFIVNTIGQTLALAVGLPVALLHWRSTFPLILRSPLLVAFIVLAYASVAWSIAPALTFRRDAALVAPILIGLVAAYRYPPQAIIRFIGGFCLILTILSLITVIAFPSIGIMSDPYNPEINGAWRGFTPHKSVLGTLMVIGFEVYAWRFFFESQHRWRHAAVAIFMMGVCLLARSSTAFIAMVFSLPLLAVLAARRSEMRMRWIPELVFWSVLIFALLFLPFLLSTLVEMLGKDISLTGRIPLWRTLIPFIEGRPLLGYGYGAFWVANSPQMILITELNPWAPPDAHNAYLGVAIDLGLVGASIATVFLLSVIVRAYRTGRSTGLAWASYFFVFTFIYAITNMVETPLLAMGNFFTFMLAFCHFSLVKHALQQAERNAPAASGPGVRAAGAFAVPANAEPGLRFRRINDRADAAGRDG